MKSKMHVIALSCLFLWTHTLNSVRAEEEPDEVRLVGGTSKCAGRLDVKHEGEWRPVAGHLYINPHSVVCRQLGCGSVVSVQWTSGSEDEDNWWVKSSCDGSESSLSDCAQLRPHRSRLSVQMNCSESVRLVNGTSLCSGRVEVKSSQSWDSVCEGNFGQLDAEVVCRELDCGAPSALQVALYHGETTAPVSTKEFQCKGSESALQDCSTSESTRNTCSADQTVGLTCSEPADFRLVRGTSSCSGRLELKVQRKWRPMNEYSWATSSRLCRELNCGSVISTKRTYGQEKVQVVCSESVRLVNGSYGSLCSGRVEVKSSQSWVSVCEGDFDRQDAEVVCRELGCGAPSELEGALYGEGKAPMSTKEFQCKGTESVLLDCGTSDSTRNTCSPAKTVGLTCSEPDEVRLVGGTSKCAGRLDVKHEGEWRPVAGHLYINPHSVVCRQLGCGSVVSVQWTSGSEDEDNWWVKSSCDGSESSLSDCAQLRPHRSRLSVQMNCSESVRLVNGTSLCSGRVEVKSSQSWDSVCEGNFGQLDAEVVCRELDCGAPSALQVALYHGETTAPVSTKEFQCKGSESALQDCSTSESTRNTCSADQTVGLTCSEPADFRLVRGTSSCSGRLELKVQRKWRPMNEYSWATSSRLCRELNCGSVISTKRTYGQEKVQVVCSESVRLVNGSYGSLCSGRVEVKSSQSWVSVCEGEFDRQDAEVVCRELGCGAPSELKGALYGEGKAPMSTKEFQCKGTESVLLDCGTSNSTRNTCSPAKTVGLTCSEPDEVRLVGGTSMCAGRLELKHEGEWRRVDGRWNRKSASVVCRQLGCGSVASIEWIHSSEDVDNWMVRSSCDGSESSLSECAYAIDDDSQNSVQVNCSESVRLVNGTNLCSGRVEVKSGQSWDSACEGDFGQQDAEVVCRELGCGAHSALQVALYGETTAPVSTKEFQCKGSESALQDCRTSDSTRNTCSADKTVGLTCSEPDDVRLVGGPSHCTGTLEIKHQGEWRPVNDYSWETSSVACRQLNCGSVISSKRTYGPTKRPVWWIRSSCEGSEASLRECKIIRSSEEEDKVEVVCSESVRLVNGTSLCSGRVEVKSRQSWVSVCEGDFNHQDAEVVCRELGCGAPSEIDRVLYGEGKAPMSTKEFQCKGTESVLLDCETSDSTRNTCSPAKTVGLSCSEPEDLRMVGGTSHCSGILEMNHELDWRPVDGSDWNLKSSFLVCRQLGCGSALSSELIRSTLTPGFKMTSSCDGSESVLSECGTKISIPTSHRLKVICSESVRLVNGTSLCSGRVEVKSSQSWDSVCEGDFNQQDAEVVCRELGCGAPTALQGALYGDTTAPMSTKQFQCKGSESVLRDCGTSDSTRNTCSADNAVGLTCSEPADVRLVGGTSHCAGKLEMKHQEEWRPVDGWVWEHSELDLRSSSVVCRQLGCGSAVSIKKSEWKWLNEVPVWWFPPACRGSEPVLRECGLKKADNSSYTLELICSGITR